MAGLRWLHRVGYLTTAVAIAAMGYCGYTQFRDWGTRGSRAAPKVAAIAPHQHDDASLWTVTTRASPHERPHTIQMCVNGTARPELWTCMGSVTTSPYRLGMSNESVSCTNPWGFKETTLVVSANGSGVVRIRHRSSADKGWSDTTISPQGACPVSLTREQQFVIVQPGGKVIDPFQATACMVRVLNTVEGVTDAKAGYGWGDYRDPWLYVQYTYPSRRDHSPFVVTFAGHEEDPGGPVKQDPAKPYFSARFSGLFDPREGNGPDVYGADKIADLWKARCGIEADISFP